MRWESQEESRRAATEKHLITGKVGLCPALPLHFSIWPFVSQWTRPLHHSVSSLSLLNSPDSISSVSSVQSQSRLMSALYWLCGMERRKEGDDKSVTPPAPAQAICSLEEKPRLRLIVNVNLLVCLSVTAFIVGYWGWQTLSMDMCGVGKNLCADFFRVWEEILLSSCFGPITDSKTHTLYIHTVILFPSKYVLLVKRIIWKNLSFIFFLMFYIIDA